MRHEVLAVAEVSQVVESVQKVVFEIEQGLGLVVHAEPEDARHTVASEKPRAVEVHRERLVLLGYFLAGLNNVWNIINRRAAQEFQRQMDVLGAAVVDIILVSEVLFQLLDKFGELGAAWYLDGQKSAFGFHGR